MSLPGPGWDGGVSSLLSSPSATWVQRTTRARSGGATDGGAGDPQLVTKRRKTVGLMSNTPHWAAMSARDKLLLGGVYLFQHLASPQLFNPSILVFFSRQGSSKPLPDSKQRREVVSEGEYRCLASWQSAGRRREKSRRTPRGHCRGLPTWCGQLPCCTEDYSTIIYGA